MTTQRTAQRIHASVLDFEVRQRSAQPGTRVGNVPQRNGFGFTNVNFSAPNYPLPGLQIRVGIFWGFID